MLGQSEIINLVLTATLVVVLFTDASAVNASRWSDEVLPARLLGIGLPLAIVFGWVVAYLLFDLEFWEAAVLGTMLAPTDAALGKAVVSNPRVPMRVRQALNVESGLNDGIALPLFLVFVETAQAVESSLDVSQLVTEVVKQLGIAIVVGAIVGIGGARVIRWGRSSGNANGYWLQIGLLGLAAVAYTVATPLGGSGFIAAWVAGLAFGRASRTFAAKAEDVDELSLFAETTGDLLTMMSFLIFGIFLGPVLAALTWQDGGLRRHQSCGRAPRRRRAGRDPQRHAMADGAVHRLVRSPRSRDDDPDDRDHRRERTRPRDDDRPNGVVHGRAQRAAPRADRMVGLESIRRLRRVAP